MPQTVRQAIDDFLSQKRIAIVGVSRKSHDFSRMMLRQWRDRGYDVIPVNPNAEALDGIAAVKQVADIQPPPDGVLLMTNPERTEQIVRECAQAGIRRVWMFRAAGAGSVSPDAVDFCRSNGISVVPGECPFMFMPSSGAIHSIHRFIRKLTGTLPR